MKKIIFIILVVFIGYVVFCVVQDLLLFVIGGIDVCGIFVNEEVLWFIVYKLVVNFKKYVVYDCYDVVEILGIEFV